MELITCVVITLYLHQKYKIRYISENVISNTCHMMENICFGSNYI